MSNAALLDEATYAVRTDAPSECERLSAENIRLRIQLEQRELRSRYNRQIRRARAKFWSTVAVLYGLGCMVITLWAVYR